MSQFNTELQMVSKTIKAYVASTGTLSNRVLSSTNRIFETSTTKVETGRNYTQYNLKSYPYYHATKVGEELKNQKEFKYQVASSHGHNGDAPGIKTDYFKHRKYHKKNEYKHGENFDNKPIYQHILKRNEVKTVSELKEDYNRMVEESKKNSPKSEQRETQEKMKDFSLGVD
ncbi:hypothetical protein DICPUDRAFT_84273 [Dictyostelium purpureum]|uniref:Uncharacterized protein n=1 Tax=Dictyostelium purpureum TaxID=5786 RepID=F1A248_DICPU|nr:uncharacterized protein DICPUDRAFT_84273 [Dictyostelium purpureum]EGC29732.1 hypothetical protein DICPUDRAFT_84273 [Dictyostelium purpureum]|eukprot:XP_003293743.1 hypothetical protein DICPUDRAFT_84273 [Dictyostelium purpureum]